MGTRSREFPLPPWTASIGGLIDAGIEVKVMCEQASCPAAAVDLVALAARVGRVYCLVGRRCRFWRDRSLSR